MNLSEGLSELKLLRAQISRLIESRKNTIKYPAGYEPAKTFEVLSKEIHGLAKQASALKLKIATQNVSVEAGEGKTIQELIFEQGDIRSELAALKSILGNKKGRFEEGVFDERYGKDDSTAFQLTRFDVEDKIKFLEKSKRKIDSQLQSANWRTTI